MAFNNGFDGDQKSLNYILETLDAKSYFIPGITASANLMVTAQGESAYFYTRSTSTNTQGKVGDQITFAAKGNKRIDVPLTSALQIGAILPRVNVETVSPDAVGDKVIQETVERINEHNRLGLVALEASAEAKEYTNGSGAYDALVDGISQFKVDNKKSGLRPTGVLVSSAFMGKLLKDERFRNASPISDLAFQAGEVRMVSGAYIVEAVDLTSDFVVMNAEGFAAPMNINNLFVVDGTTTGYPGSVLITGETGYGFKVVTKAEDKTLDQTNGYLVAKYTEAAA